MIKTKWIKIYDNDENLITKVRMPIDNDSYEIIKYYALKLQTHIIVRGGYGRQNASFLYSTHGLNYDWCQNLK